MRSWLMYWRPDTDRSGILNHAASDQLGKVAGGDEVWFVTMANDELVLFGHMLVGELMSQSRAEAVVGKDIWEAKYHIVPKRKSRALSRSSYHLDSTRPSFPGRREPAPARLHRAESSNDQGAHTRICRNGPAQVDLGEIDDSQRM